MGNEESSYIKIRSWLLENITWDFFRLILAVLSPAFYQYFEGVPKLTDIYPSYVVYPAVGLFIYGILQVITDIVRILSGNKVKAKIDIEVFPRHSGGYASVKIHNKEIEDLIESVLMLKDVFVLDGEKRISKINEINPDNANISWASGGNKKKVITGKNHAVFNLAKIEKGIFFFLFDDGRSAIVGPGIYEVELVLDGRIRKSNKKINRKEKRLFVEFSEEIFEEIVDTSSDGEVTKRIKQGFFVDIRESDELNKDKQLTGIRELGVNEFIRHKLRK